MTNDRMTNGEKTNREPGSGGKWELRVALSAGSPAATVSVSGRVSGANAARLDEALEGAWIAGTRRIVLDLQGVDYLSSAGVDVLGRMSARLANAGGELLVVHVQAPVGLVLDLAAIPFKA
jgi:anti-anti-sigma factor